MTTTASRPRRLLLCLLVVATLATAAYATTASAAANPQPIPTTQDTQTGQNTDPQPCTGLLNGTTFTNTVTEQGHMVTNADGTFHEFLTVTFDLREDWTDGSYLIDQSVGTQAFNINATGTNTFSGAQQDRGTLYSPTGQILGYSVIFTQFHGTVVDGTPLPPHDQFRIISSPC